VQIPEHAGRRDGLSVENLKKLIDGLDRSSGLLPLQFDGFINDLLRNMFGLA